MDDKWKFDGDGFHRFDIPEEFNFIVEAYITREDFEDRMLYIEFYDGYLADFEDESIADKLDEKLKTVEGIENVHWEDRELFRMIYAEGNQIKDLLKRIDERITNLSKEFDIYTDDVLEMEPEEFRGL